MIFRAQWFGLDELPTTATWAELPIDGYGEWNDSVPALVFALLGANPTSHVWLHHDSHCVLHVCDRRAAAARLTGLQRMLASESASACAGMPALRVAMQLLADSERSLFGLLTTELALQANDSDALTAESAEAWLSLMNAQAAAWSSTLLDPCDPDPASPSFRALAETLRLQPGCWTAAVVGGMSESFDHEPSDVPEAVATVIGAPDPITRRQAKLGGYEAAVEAYHVVVPVGLEDWRRGLLTHYGRWLIPPVYDTLSTCGRGSPLNSTFVASLHADGGSTTTGLLSSNGAELLPFAYRYVFGCEPSFVSAMVGSEGTPDEHWEVYRRAALHGSLQRLPIEAWLRHRREEDGLCIAEFTSFEGRRLTGPNRIGLVDETGHVVVPPHFADLSPFHKGTGLAMAQVQTAGDDGETVRAVGLIDRSGRTVLSIEYSDIGSKRRNAPPHFVKKSCVIEKPNAGGSTPLVGIADSKGRVLLKPDGRYSRYHLQWTLNKEGFILAFDNAPLPAGADPNFDRKMVSIFHDGRCEPLGMTWGVLAGHLGLMPAPGKTPDVAPIGIAVDEAGHGLAEFATALLPSAEYVQALFPTGVEAAVSDFLASHANDRRVTVEDIHGFVDALLVGMRDCGLLMHVDWKATDQIDHASSHLAGHPGMAAFEWTGLAEGEDMRAGIEAIALHAAENGLDAFEYDDGSDSHHIGLVATSRRPGAEQQARKLSLPLRWILDQ